MEQFKIDIFENETGKKFEFSELDSGEIHSITNFLNQKLSYAVSSSELFFEHVRTRLKYFRPSEDIDNPALISNLIKDLGFDSGKRTCYMVWNLPNKIDRLDTDFLKDNWEYVWYPNGDDALLVVIQDLNLFILVTHYGEIRYEVID